MPHRPITSADVATLPQPGYNLADSVQFSPDDNLITYLRSPNQSLTRQLYAYDLQAGKEYVYAEPQRDDGNAEENLSMEEQLRREVGRFSHCSQDSRKAFHSEHVDRLETIRSTNSFFSFSDNAS